MTQRSLKQTLLATLALTLAVPALAADPAPTGNPYLTNVPASPGLTLPSLPSILTLPSLPSIPKLPARGTRPYEMSGVVPQDVKAGLIKSVMPLMNMTTRMDLKDMMNLMTIKYKAKPGLTFEEVKASMELRANSLNFKKVGESLMWKDFQAVLGDMAAPRVEVYHYCDIAVGREMLKYAPESVVYMPCRFTIMEDADKNIWVMTLDWDTTWLDSVKGRMGTPDALWDHAVIIRDKMDNIMRAAANGDL
ncbi:MAG: DUF302 domain-containing protein [Pseudomonadota bacterium]|nr:DUF302 domain-containing protein [Pseudomonadota bacterium]